MQPSHDRHTYFFEKYLRKEMGGEEQAAFEKRLEDDAAFRNDFNYYVAHRNEIQKGELAEYDEPELLRPKPQRWGWVYAAISLLCLVLIIDYFFSASYTPEGKMVRKEPLIDRINIFKPHPSSEKADSKETKSDAGKNMPSPESLADTADVKVPLDSQLLPELIEEGAAIRGDFFVSDSLFKVLDQAQINERMAALTDSTTSDTALLVPVLKGFFKGNAALPRQLLVEFWSSPIHFKGYLFNGKKLLLYEVDPTDAVFLSCAENNTNYHLFINGREYHLFADHQLHQLSEE